MMVLQQAVAESRAIEGFRTLQRAESQPWLIAEGIVAGPIVDGNGMLERIEFRDLGPEAIHLLEGEIGVVAEQRLGAADVPEKIPRRREARERVADVARLLGVGAGEIRGAAKESGEGKHNHAPAREFIEDAFHALILRRVERPELRRFPVAAATRCVAIQIVARDRERVVALSLSPIEEGGALRLVPVFREKPVANVKRANERRVAVAPAEPL